MNRARLIALHSRHLWRLTLLSEEPRPQASERAKQRLRHLGDERRIERLDDNEVQQIVARADVGYTQIEAAAEDWRVDRRDLQRPRPHIQRITHALGGMDIGEMQSGLD